GYSIEQRRSAHIAAALETSDDLNRHIPVLRNDRRALRPELPAAVRIVPDDDQPPALRHAGPRRNEALSRDIDAAMRIGRNAIGAVAVVFRTAVTGDPAFFALRREFESEDVGVLFLCVCQAGHIDIRAAHRHGFRLAASGLFAGGSFAETVMVNISPLCLF